MLIAVAIQIAAFLILEAHSLAVYQHPLVINFSVLWKFALVYFAILFLFGKLFDRNHLRVDGKYLGYCLIIINFFLLGALSGKIEQLTYGLKEIKKPEEIFNHRTHKNFRLKYALPIDARISGYHFEVSSSRRSSYNNYTHYLTIPVKAFQADWHRLWLGESFTNKIRKHSLFEKVKQTNTWFVNKKKREFRESLKREPHFYEVVYSDFNQSFREKGFYSSALASYKSVVPLIVLRPHFEPYNDYKQSTIEIILLLISGILLVCVISSAVAAYYR